MSDNLAKTNFIYFNDFVFKEDFEVKHCVGSTIITTAFLTKMIQSNLWEHYQVFSFGIGVLIIYDYNGNVYNVTPCSGLVDAIAFLTIFTKNHSVGDRTIYDAWEFYRVTENDNDYQVSIDFLESSIKLRYKEKSAIFDELEFIKGLLIFADDIIDWYDKKYPLFLQSPIRSEIIELKEKVIAKYFNNNKLSS